MRSLAAAYLCFLFSTLLVVDGANYNDMTARSFLCDAQWREVATPKPLSMGSTIRVCVETTKIEQLDLHILKLSEYRFAKDVILADGSKFAVQQAVVQAGVVVDDQREDTTTTLQCLPGSSICALETTLKDDFFRTNGVVKGIGSVALQLGGGQGRRRRRNLRRQLQQGFAGMIDLYLEFETVANWVDESNVADEINPLSPLSDEDPAPVKGHWVQVPDYVKALYIMVAVVAALFIFCFFAACILWDSHCKHIYNRTGSRRTQSDGEDDEDEDHYIHNYDRSSTTGKGKSTDDDISETYSLDDDEGWEIEGENDQWSMSQNATTPSSPRRAGSVTTPCKQVVVYEDAREAASRSSRTPKKSPSKSPRKTPKKKISSKVEVNNLPHIPPVSPQRTTSKSTKSTSSTTHVSSESPKKSPKKKLSTKVQVESLPMTTLMSPKRAASKVSKDASSPVKRDVPAPPSPRHKANRKLECVPSPKSPKRKMSKQ